MYIYMHACTLLHVLTIYATLENTKQNSVGVHGGLDSDDQTRAICINLYTYVCALAPYCTQSLVAFLYR